MNFVNAKIIPCRNGWYIEDTKRGTTYFSESHEDAVKCAKCVDKYYEVTSRYSM